LFPSEVTRVRNSIKSIKELAALSANSEAASITSSIGSWSNILGSGAGSNAVTQATMNIPPEWAHSSVMTFRTRYMEPIQGLSTMQSVEALIEGSEMSKLREGGIITPELAWLQREGRNKRYEGKRLGGTVVVHFIKKNMWYLETALALLGGEDETALERQRRRHTAMANRKPLSYR
jgi:hypothetical protein